LLTVTSLNLSPTNSLITLVSTNTLVNTPLTIAFSVGDDRTPASGLTYIISSADNTLIPSANVGVANQGTANPRVTIMPANNQVGVALISVGVNDNDANEPRTTTANIPVMVRPNTNVVLVDFFNYDNGGGPLDSVSAGYWTHLSGTTGQLIAGNGVAVVDTLDNRENVQAQLLGAPYNTNSGATLYASFTINMNPRDLPLANGTYFALFNDGSGTTGPYEGRVVAATNNAAPGFYRIGINNFGADATTGEQFPLDLIPGTNYVVVEALVLTNGFSTVWINPNGPGSPSVTDTTPAPAATNLYNIADFELRESGADAGSISVGSLKVGTTFDSVLPSLHINAVGANVILNWSDPTLGVQTATNVAGPYVDIVGATPPYTNSISTNSEQFYRFGQ